MTEPAGVFKGVPVPLGSNRARRRFAGMPHNHDASYNRDDEQKPARPQRMAQEPDGAEPSVQSPKLMTDPATGEPRREPPQPSQADDAER